MMSIDRASIRLVTTTKHERRCAILYLGGRGDWQWLVTAVGLDAARRIAAVR